MAMHVDAQKHSFEHVSGIRCMNAANDTRRPGGPLTPARREESRTLNEYFATAVVASFLPSLRATRVDPRSRVARRLTKRLAPLLVSDFPRPSRFNLLDRRR
jgi:hypothetical protein